MYTCHLAKEITNYTTADTEKLRFSFKLYYWPTKQPALTKTLFWKTQSTDSTYCSGFFLALRVYFRKTKCKNILYFLLEESHPEWLLMT